MRRGRQFLVLSGLALLAGCLLAPAAARAVVVGSPHDFSATGPFTQSSAIAPSGACSGCHIPHGADAFTLWSRNLEPYRSNLVNDGDPSSVPDYVPPPAIQCYDCHDYHSGSNPDALPNNVPDLTFFNSNHKPQNIAAGFARNNLPGVYNANNMTPDPWGGTVSGYYENKPPYGSSYGADPNLAPTAVPYPSDNTALLKTGGHYFKRNDPTGTTGDDFDIGDKLPCRDCHDPHAWSSDWQAFIKPNLGGTTGWGRVTPSDRPTASRYMANEFTLPGSRNDSYSRTLCIACHGYSNALDPVSFSAVSSAYSSNVLIVRPPDSIAEHRNGSAVACVSCHLHNSVEASCGDCHGNPPPGYPSGKNPETAGGAYGVTPEQTHARHVGHFSDNTTRFSPYSFVCTVCHAGSGLHQDNNVNVVYDLSSLGKGNPPPFQPFTGATYVRSTCANVYCHSLGLSDNTVNPVVPPSTTVPYYRSVTWGTASLGCNGCHGTTTVSGTPQFGMPEYTSGAGGSASANSHAAHVVNNGYECSVCHYDTADGTYQTARSIRGAPAANARHVNGGRDIVFDGATATGSYNEDDTVQANNKRCAVSCHNSQALPLAQRPQWGDPATATCTACHLASAADSDQYLLASDTWFQNSVAANLDNTEWTWSGHGKSSGSYDVSGRPAAALLAGGTGDNPCLYCHDPSVGHRDAANPFRLKDQTGVSGFSGLGWNATCLVCHRKTLPRPGYDPDNAATVYANQVADNAFVDNNHHGAEHTTTNGGRFCWDCHDPHGDRIDGGPGNIYMVHKGNLARQTEGTYGYPGSGGALTNNAPVFTNVTTGTNYADNTTFRGICQVCHTLGTTGHYRYNYGDGHNEGSRCTTCHAHDAGFAASKCEGCHGGENGELAAVYNAPKVTTHWKTSGHGKATSPVVTCESCHDVSDPAGFHDTQGNGDVNTLNWQGKSTDTTSTNTPHLKDFFFPIPPATASQYALAMDAACGEREGCHVLPGGGRNSSTPKRMEHAKDGLMQFGTKGTRSDPKGAGIWYSEGPAVDFRTRAPWLIADVKNDVSPATPRYGLCVSCHDPHGTGAPHVTDTVGQNDPRNVMVRGNWKSDPAGFCAKVCH